MEHDMTVEDFIATNGLGTGGSIDTKDRSVPSSSLYEYRSCENVENGNPSTAPPFWDSDGEDDDPVISGPRPSDLFGRYTWRIENFSKEKKREMKSEPFEAGGYKWYILVYPQGCDVSNHLSLFLCVANHDKLLPGWSHFAQFTIAVGNHDPKKIKYSDTLHRFWKKEHDWGWKKFMELSKIHEGFLVDDVLEIIAQVQVIREKVDRPFRCLDRPYRRELLRVYMTNIEQIYRRFVEERRSRLCKLIEDKLRWSSFCAFWLAIDKRTRHRMSRERSDVILKIIVKDFFVEKEVTSTLVMDSLYTGLKALEYQSKNKSKKGIINSVDFEELPVPMVHVDMDMFVLAGDVIALLDRAALEPLPCQPVSPKDDKCSQSRTKDGSGEVNKVSIECEERRLTELGQMILETFALSHIFSGIEVAYQEAVALKRQEELIREEEEAWLLETEMKAKRGGTTEKDKRSKKKQAKQKKNNRKVKDKDREEKSNSNFAERSQDENTIHGKEDSKQAGRISTKIDASEEGASDVSDNLDESTEIWKKHSSMENKSSSCSSESSTMSIVQDKRNNSLDSKDQISRNRGKTQRSRSISNMNSTQDVDDLPSSTTSSDRNSSGCGPAPKLDQETVLLTLKDRLRKLGERLHEKEIEGRKLLQAHLEKKAAAEAATCSSSSLSSNSLEETPEVLKSPDQSSVTTSAADINASPPKSLAVVTNDASKVTPAKPATILSTNSVPTVVPTLSKAEPVLCEGHVSSSAPQIDTPINSSPLQVDKAATLLSGFLLVDQALPVPSKSSAPQVDKVSKAVPAPPKSPAPQVDKVSIAVPTPLKSPATQVEKVAKAIPVRPKSPATQVEKVTKAIPTPKSPAPQVDKVTPLNPVSRQMPPASNSEAREVTVPKKAAIPSISQTPVISRPSSAPLFQAPRSTLPPTSAVQVPSMLSRSLTVAGRSRNEQSPSIPSYAGQTYRNAIVGKTNLDTSSASLDQSTSFGQSVTPSQPLSTYASAASAMVPPVGRDGQLASKQCFMFGQSKSEENWHPWKGDNDANKHMWVDDSPYHETTNSDIRTRAWMDNSYQQVSCSRTDEQSEFGGLHKQFQREVPTNPGPYQLPGPMGEEFPHIDIINDLLEEEQSSGSMAESTFHEYHSFGLPFSSRGNLVNSEVTSAGSSGRLNLTDHYYDEGYPVAYDRLNALYRLREGQFSTLDAYSNGRMDSITSKPWLHNFSNPAVNLGANLNGFSRQMGNYTNLGSGRMNGEYLYHHANGQW
ncbi:TNF receptor-associated factor homolog 1b-like isoform X2 [Oryza brachyantha]|uniref:MATH domain-containing protein n=1 Tax=Oryza brachyantha TaxID=4533 RepID=J3L4K9_ORYBR|nr:TNF receptor-associated factor homolog 1b-like isoform X2 [Oryza brachyantha]